ncbi:YkyA family protein [Aureibacillus halotolerans]|uniref:Putative cell-wall binding lipoprotein n=1 Tax=Aureibacillus halotolerans TaxID=1508390 RepID=A0A4R6U6W5_9BACI|nr:YkyA family protein [Aureibacillus halotolerans]TDQ42258.1 putative cell-wall binding lipoprotein [Aureibacillus halotolerans]
MKSVLRTIGFAVILFTLSACSFGASTAEEMYEHLEKALELEAEFQEQQEPLVELEKEEHKIYEEMITLTTEQMDQINALSEEALATINEREERLQKEQASIQASQEEFKKVEALVADLEEENVQQSAEELVTTMEERYSTYQLLNEAYTKAIALEKEMYTMVTDENMTMEQFTEQVEKINTAYEDVSKANKTFNDLTNKYNTLKPAFYEQAGLDIVFEGNDTEVDGASDNESEGQEDAS